MMTLAHMLSPTQWTFLAGSSAYPLVFYLSLPANPTPTRFAKSREAISLFHCTLMTALSIVCLKQSSVFALLAAPTEAARASKPSAQVDDSKLPVIATKSSFGNALTVLETAYLLQDSVVLFYADRLHRRVRSSGLKPTKGLNIKHLAWHHAGLSCAFGVLQWYIYQGREKGILIVILMMLMNASSPVGTVRWYLVNFQPHRRLAISLATIAYLTCYGFCRVYLVYYILEIFGAQKGQSAFEAFRQLRWHCQMGTGTMAVVNTSWLFMGVRNFVQRGLSRALDGKRID